MNMQFYGLLRWDEVSALRIPDFTFHTEHMDVRIRRSKTDQLRVGATVRVARHQDSPHSCPVNLTWIYMRMLRYAEGVNGLMQPRIKQGSDGQGGWANLPLSYSRALQDLKDLMEKTGRDGNAFDEHSGRRGGATAAAEAGAKWTDLKKLGRWASDAAPQLYVENTERRRSELPLLLAAAAQRDRRAGKTTSPRDGRPSCGSRDLPPVQSAPAPVHLPGESFTVLLPPAIVPPEGPAVTLPRTL